MSEMDAAAPVPALPEDVVSEILARVPDVVSLFRCAAVCRLWRRLVADPAFLRRCRLWPAGGGSSLLGFFVQRHQLSVNARRKVSKLFPSRAPVLVPPPGSPLSVNARRKVSKLFPSRAPVLVPPPGSPLGPGRRFLTSFVRDDAGILDQANPMAARGGLLLVRISLRSTDKSTALRLCICDLLAGKCDLLPPLDVAHFGDEGVRGLAVLTAADHGAGPHRPANGYSTFFQVLLICQHQENGRMYILKFSSAAAASRGWRWRCILRSFVGPFGNRVAAVTRGTARWLLHKNGGNQDGPSVYTLDVGVSTGAVSTTKLPLVMRADMSDLWLCLSAEERISLIYLCKNHLWVLIQKDGDPGGIGAWQCTQATSVGVEVGLFGIESLSMVSVGEKSGTLLTLYYSDPGNAYVLDLKSGLTTKLAGWNRSFNYMTAVACEINWLEFFKSRLSVHP